MAEVENDFFGKPLLYRLIFNDMLVIIENYTA
jgi:hypothetical protein